MSDEKNMRQDLLNQMPGMPSLMNHPNIKELRDHNPTLFVNDIIRKQLDGLRQLILTTSEESLSNIKIDSEAIAEKVLDLAERSLEPSVKPAINAAGVILHTALGRAVISDAAQNAVANAIQGYCTLAISEETGKRGDRHAHLDKLIAHITGAEAGIIVNNNAAATMLILNTLADGKEVIVSRGQLIEIGGAFRIPDVMERSGCKLIEVGTTNRTHLRDYEKAITDETAAILRVHTSNYRIIGFTGEVPLTELSALGKKYDLPVIDDLGSGAIIDLSQWGLPKEPTIQESVRDGMDVICFSGDKMFGGPQSGFIIGHRDIIDKVKKNPLTRALRGDKMQYAAAEATLKLYLEPEKLSETHPVIQMITEPALTIKKRTQNLRRRLLPLLKDKAQLDVIPSTTEMGSGSLPGDSIPSFALRLIPTDRTSECISDLLRKNRPPVFTRIVDNAMQFDLRTVRQSDQKTLADAIVNSFCKAHKE